MQIVSIIPGTVHDRFASRHFYISQNKYQKYSGVSLKLKSNTLIYLLEREGGNWKGEKIKNQTINTAVFHKFVRKSHRMTGGFLNMAILVLSFLLLVLPPFRTGLFFILQVVCSDLSVVLSSCY